MSFYFSKSKFVAAWSHCDKYAWLDKNNPDEKTPPSEYTLTLFANGHIVGELAKEHFNIDVDITTLKGSGEQDVSAMIEKTKQHLAKGTKTIAEASFSYNGLFCSVDILVRNDDGTYTINEVKSSKQTETRKYNGVKEKYVIDAAYQQYVLEKCGIKVSKVCVVLLSNTYVMGEELDLEKYFVECDVTEYAKEFQDVVESKLVEIESVINGGNEPETVFTKNCNYCDYFVYCAKAKGVLTPSPFDLYDINFDEKCELYNEGISFFDIPAIEKKLNDISSKNKTKSKKTRKLGLATCNQITYYNRPNDTYIDKMEIKKFLDSLKFPLYSLDFETYESIVPEFSGQQANTQYSFQYSLHVIKDVNDIMCDEDLEERHFIDLSGRDIRRNIAERIVKDIPAGACIIACNMITESGIIKKLAECFKDLHDHLMSFRYVDPQDLFQKGYYYNSRMGRSFSLKSILPALYPDEKDMNYQNLDGEVKNGREAMNAILKAKELEGEALEKYKKDLIEYCALDTYAIVKVLKKLYEAI
jgi:CRISPR/Cas system-associated exonuclease Cas4 (RecB family)